MADGADSMNQDEIDAQLRQAFEPNAGSDSSAEATDQSAAAAESAAAESADQGSNLLGQDEADALLAAAGLGATAPAPRSATDQATPKAAPPKSQSSSAQSHATDSDIQALLMQAEEAVASVDEPIQSAVSGLAPYELKDLTGSPASTQKASLDLLRDVELDLRIELGRTLMHLEDVLQLRQGSVVPLDRLAGDPVDVFVNGRLVARGEILVLNDNFCVRVAELIASEEPC